MNSKSPTDPAPAGADPEQRVFEPEHLRHWSFQGTSLAVLGHPVRHSISPAMHNAALARMARTDPRFHKWCYFKFDIPPDQLPEVLPLFHQHRFRGINLTIPHKTEVLPLLSQIDPDARRMGAVNTLVWTPDGYEGYNTDGYGLSTATAEEPGFPLSSGPVILLGAGGAARAAAVQCLLNSCPELWLGNRNPERLDSLYRDLVTIRKPPTRLETFGLKDLPHDLPGRALIVNATSLGLSPEDPAPVDLASLRGDYSVYDMIYPGPGRPETALLREARRLGFPAAHGLSMLIHQGARSLEIWSGGSVSVDAMRQAAERALAVPEGKKRRG